MQLKKIIQLLGAFVFGAMFVIGLIIIATTPNVSMIPVPDRAVIGGALAMFATVGGFALAFVEAATQQT